MYPTTLRPLLANPSFAPGDITAAAVQCQDWFRNTASLEAFVLAAIFHDLIARDWDKQAVPTAEWKRFTGDVLPRMVAVLDTLPADPAPALRALVIGFHSSI
jgi:hypothetical protein